MKTTFGKILRGQDFRFPGRETVFRRTQGRFARPVSAIEGNLERYGGTEYPLDLASEVERVLHERPRD